VFSQLLVHTTGRWAGHPFRLEAWQRRDLITPLFGTVQWSREANRWVRQYSDLWLELPRRNGKSSLLAGIALVLTVADDEPGAEVFGCALDREQAGKVFDIAERMVDLSPVLSRRLKVYRQARRIVDEATGSYYCIISGDAAGNLGHNPHGVVFDEVLTQKDRQLWDAMRNSFGSRDQPLFLAATTAGADPSSLAAQEHEYSSRVADRRITDRRRLVYIRGAPTDARWDDPAVWRKANPALGRFLSIEALRRDAKTALASPAAQTAFRQFRLNQWVRPVTFWLDLGRWDATAGMVVESKLAGRRCYGGLDLANTRDVTALCWVFPDDADPPGYDAVWRYFLPEELVPSLDARTAGAASAWVRQGWITLTPGDVLDHKAVLAQIDRDAQAFDVAELAYDRWGMAQMMTDLADAGLTVVPFGQGYASMGPASRELERLMLAAQLRHGGNPVSRWMAANAVVRRDPAGNIKPDKEHSGDKIDGIVALAMALDRAVRHAGGAPRSVYEDRGLTVG
jgi:phage terminase large subunit-like protein